MKSVNQVKRQESLKKWLEIIKDQRASGLSVLAYCKHEGIANTTFYYWQNQIQKLLIQQHEQQEKAKAFSAVKPASKKPVANAKKRMCSLLRCHQQLQRKLRVLWSFAVALSSSLSQRPRHPSF